jgi:FkbM family methyltransferase
MSSASDVIFEANYSGVSTRVDENKRKLFAKLFSISQDHVLQKRRQLVVFSFDFIGHHINLDGVFEKGELDTVFQWLSANAKAFSGVAIDVGANIGNHSLYFSDHYQSVYSFEPNPRTFQVLKINSQLVKNVKCFDCGISSENRSANLNVYANNIGHSDVADEATQDTVPIKLSTLDAVIDQDLKVRLLKIDVEGHEYQAILGSKAVIEANRPVILFEQLSAEFEGGSSKVINLLKSMGYTRFASVKRRTRKIQTKNFFLNPIFKILNSLPIGRSYLFGTSWVIQTEEHFAATDYPLIIAIPDWMA